MSLLLKSHDFYNTNYRDVTFGISNFFHLYIRHIKYNNIITIQDVLYVTM